MSDNQKFLTMDHDRFFKIIFGEPAQAASLLRFALPEKTAQLLELDKMEPLPTEFVDNIGGEGRADLLFHCQLKNMPDDLLIAVLFEHKSAVDNEAIHQIAHYWAAIVLKYKKMPILPVLFYHGAENWKPATLREQFPWLPPEFAMLQPDFPVVFVDLAREEDKLIHNNPHLDGITKAGLVMMKHIFDKHPDIENIIQSVTDNLAEVEPNRKASLLESVFIYLIKKGAEKNAPMETIMDLLPEAQKMPFRTWEDGIRERATAEGLAVGLAEGHAEGHAEGLAEGLAKALHETARVLMLEGIPINIVSKATGLNEEEIKALQ